MRIINRRRTAVTAALVVGGLGASIASAAWLATGTGFGQAQAVTAVNLTVNAASGAADLYPGFADGDVFFTVTNPNPYAVNFTDATFGLVTSSDEIGCPAATNVVVDASATGLTLPVAANAAPSALLSIPDAISMLSTAADACQGQTFNIVVTLAGVQV